MSASLASRSCGPATRSRGVEDVETLGAEARRQLQAPEVPPRPRGESRLLPQFRLRQRERARRRDAGRPGPHRELPAPASRPGTGTARRGGSLDPAHPSSAMTRAKSCFVDDAVDPRRPVRPPQDVLPHRQPGVRVHRAAGDDVRRWRLHARKYHRRSQRLPRVHGVGPHGRGIRGDAGGPTLILDVRSGDRASAGAPHARRAGSRSAARRVPGRPAGHRSRRDRRRALRIPRRSTAAAGGRCVATFEGSITGYRFASVRPAPTARAARRLARAAARAVVDVDGPAGLPCARWSGSAGTSRPVTSTRSTSAGCCRAHDRCRRRPVGAGAPARRRQSGALPGRARPRGGLGGHRLAGAVPAPRRRQWSRPARSRARPAPRRTVRGQGLSREHHDHRPGPQRPGPDRPAGIGACDRAAASGRSIPGSRIWSPRCRPASADGVGWGEILAATFPPGSVTGAPKIRALQVIAELEPVPRGPYCGAIGFVDADRGQARLAVGIRTFFSDSRDRCPGRAPAGVVRHRRRDHLLLRPGGRVAGDGTQGGAADVARRLSRRHNHRRSHRPRHRGIGGVSHPARCRRGWCRVTRRRTPARCRAPRRPGRTSTRRAPSSRSQPTSDGAPCGNSASNRCTSLYGASRSTSGAAVRPRRQPDLPVLGEPVGVRPQHQQVAGALHRQEPAAIHLDRARPPGTRRSPRPSRSRSAPPQARSGRSDRRS